MSSMSSAQIVSAGSAIHNKMPPALVGPLALHASTPVSYPGAVSPDLGEPHETFFLSAFFFKRANELQGERRRDLIKCRLIKLLYYIILLMVSHDESLLSKTSGLNFSRFYNRCIDSLIFKFLRSIFTFYRALKTRAEYKYELLLLSKISFIEILDGTFQGNFSRRFSNT